MLLRLTNTTTTRIINTKVLVVAMDNLVSVVDGGIVAVVGDKRAAGVDDGGSRVGGHGLVVVGRRVGRGWGGGQVVFGGGFLMHE